MNFDIIDDELRTKALECMVYLEIPDYEKKPDNKPVHPINKQHLFQEISFLADSSRKIAVDHHWHCMRLGIYSVMLMDYFGLENKEWRQKIFSAYFTHDADKGAFVNQLSKDNISSEDLEILNSMMESTSPFPQLRITSKEASESRF